MLSKRSNNELDHASIPPRGWNSYDSFCWTISEEEFLQSAEIVSQRLRPHGYQVHPLPATITSTFYYCSFSWFIIFHFHMSSLLFNEPLETKLNRFPLSSSCF